jgi:predicted HAD superfamily Cof-like phosphohydrolase
MKDVINKVSAFYNMVGDNQHIPTSPQIIPTSSRRDLKIRLIQEELNELKEAADNKDIVEVADALADLTYVLAGAILEFGMGDRFHLIFDEVHRSNMSKGFKNSKDIDETIDHYERINVSTYIRQGENVIRRSEDDKILKSINYSKANLQPIISLDSNDLPVPTPTDSTSPDRCSSAWKLIEKETGRNGVIMTHGLSVPDGVLLRIRAYDKNLNIVGVEMQYVPGLTLEERNESIEEGIITTYHLIGL